MESQGIQKKRKKELCESFMRALAHPLFEATTAMCLMRNEEIKEKEMR